MTIDRNTESALAELTHLLDAWGGSPPRWPPRVRLRIAELVAADPAALALVAEARALDRVLDTAREAPVRIEAAKANALTDRILAAALASDPAAQTVEQQAAAMRPVAAMPDAVPSNVVTLRSRARTPSPISPLPGTRWHAAGLMAASLLVGIYLGGSLNLAPVLQEVADAVGITASADPTLGDDLGEDDAL